MNQKLTKARPTSVRRSPFRDIFPRSVFEDLFDQYLTEGDGGLSEMMNVSMDVAESDHAFEVKVDLPGVDADNVDIQIENNTLTVRGKRTEESEEKDEAKQYHRVERYSGSFARSVVLPSSINENETVAEFKDGVLKIQIPKADEAKARKIQIKK